MTEWRRTENSVEVRISRTADALAAPSACAELARALGFSKRAVHEIEISASELATNVLRHGGGGTLTARAISDPFDGIELVAVDRGPGFADVEAALTDGYSQGKDLVTEVPPTLRSGLGSGLGAVSRLTDEVRIDNGPTGGAVVSARKRLR